MMFLLDTNICIHYLNGSYAGLTRRVLAAGPELLAVSALTVAELQLGAERSSRPEANRERLEVFFRELTAAATGRTLVSGDGHMKEMPGIPLENWLQAVRAE